MSARVIQVIETSDRRGLGVTGDPVRMVKQYFTLEGVLLWEEPDEWRKPHVGTFALPPEKE